MHIFQWIANCTRWPKLELAQVIVALLSGEAYYALTPTKSMNYDKVKAELLACCDLSPTDAAAEFHKWGYKSGGSPQKQNGHPSAYYQKVTAGEVTEQVAMDKFVRLLQAEECKAVRMQSSNNPKNNG